MKRATFILLMAVLVASFGRAGDLAVVVDISGSMAKYGPWQPDARRVVRSIVETGSLGDESDNWSVSGDVGLVKYFEVVSGDHIQLIKFGSIHPNVSTFFPVESLSTPTELDSKFPAIAEFKEARTNKELATAVAVKLVSGPRTPARIISISDFLSDADLNLEQQEFVNAVMKGTAVENTMILSWKKNPRVMLRLQKITLPTGSVTALLVDAAGQKGTLELIPAHLNSDSKTLLLAWRPIGPKPIRFDVKVVSSDGTQLLSKAGLLATEVLLNDPPGGELTWTVSAHYAGGEVSSASRREVLPDNGNTGAIITILLIGALLIAGFFFMRKHGDNLIAGIRKAFGRSAGSDI